jgi:putative transposase
MQPLEPLTPGNYYHIYNRGIDGCELFHEPENNEYFLGLYDKYILPVAETYAWVLMKNHFHFLIRVREEKSNLTGFQNLSGLRPPHQHFLISLTYMSNETNNFNSDFCNKIN